MTINYIIMCVKFVYRILKENRLFGGLWHGSKPDMALFLKPLAKFLQTAFKDGRYYSDWGWQPPTSHPNRPLESKVAEFIQV